MPRPIRDLECYLHDETLKDIVAAHLYSMTMLQDDEEVLELTLGPPNAEGVRPIRFKTIKTREVELIVHS